MIIDASYFTSQSIFLKILSLKFSGNRHYHLNQYSRGNFTIDFNKKTEGSNYLLTLTLYFRFRELSRSIFVIRPLRTQEIFAAFSNFWFKFLNLKSFFFFEEIARFFWEKIFLVGERTFKEWFIKLQILRKILTKNSSDSRFDPKIQNNFPLRSLLYINQIKLFKS